MNMLATNLRAAAAALLFFCGCAVEYIVPEGDAGSSSGLEDDDDSSSACAGECNANTEVCDGTECSCRAGFRRCGQLCVDLEVDPEHCGECGEQCTEVESGGVELYVCQNGNCRDEELGCAARFTDCGQTCVKLDTHPLHCGDCDRACGGEQACVDAECVNL